jgi:hypothetical protein
MRDERLIGGALVSIGINNTPPNISLTHLGRKALDLYLFARMPESL